MLFIINVQKFMSVKNKSTGNFNHVTQFLALQLLTRLTVTNDLVN